MGRSSWDFGREECLAAFDGTSFEFFSAARCFAVQPVLFALVIIISTAVWIRLITKHPRHSSHKWI